jgi:hypothetical protein
VYNHRVSLLFVVTAVAGGLALGAAVVALVTIRVERIAGAAAVAAGALALCATLAGGAPLGGLLAVGGVGVLAPVAAGAVVMGLDGRPGRISRPIKLLLLLPLVVVALAFVVELDADMAHLRVHQPAQGRSSGEAPEKSPGTLLVLLALAATPLSALLLVRRREAS